MAQPTDFDRQLDDFVRQRLAELETVPGIGIAVVRGDRIIYERGFGLRDVEAQLPVTPTTRFYIASSTKTITGLAAARLEAAGRIDLERSLAEFYPAGTFDPAIAADEIDLLELMSHDHTLQNSGLQFRLAFVDEPDPETFYQVLRDFSTPREKEFSYSNLSYNLIADILERVTGQHWRELNAAHVLGPLGMQHTTAFASRAARTELAYPYYRTPGGAFQRLPIKEDGQMQSAGGYYATPGDLARLLLVNMNAGRLDGRQVVEPAVIRRTQRARSSQERTFLDFQRFGYGLGWQHALYEGDTLLHHFGGFTGYQAHMSFMPEHDIGVVVLANEAQTASILPHLIAMYSYDLLLDKSGRAEKYATLNAKVRTGVAEARERWAGRLAQKAEQLAQAATNPENWSYRPQDFVGRYYNPRIGTIEATLNAGGQLLATWGPGTAPLLPHAQDLFLANWAELEPPVPLRVQYTADGAVFALNYGHREFRRLPVGIRQEDLPAIYAGLHDTLAELAGAPASRVAVAIPQLLDRAYPTGAITEPYLNALGYRHLRAEDHALALAVFQYAVQRYPSSANAYDSLGEAYLAAEDTAKAITNYRKSLELDPENENARRVLEALEQH